MHETITLQFGQPANYLATHFWNTQVSFITYLPLYISCLPRYLSHLGYKSTH